MKRERKNRWFSVVLGALVFVLGFGSSVIESKAFTGETKISFYLLDSSMEIPDEPSSNPKQNYTADGVTGTLYAEIANQITTDRATWVVDGVYGNDVSSMLVNHPAASELGVTQEEYNKVYWYVLKREVDGLHVDGVVMNRQYNVTINYGYLDENNSFVKFDASVIASKNMKVNFNDVVTENTVLDGYNRISPDVTLKIVRDTEINVVFSKVEEEVVTKEYYKVMYRYFLGELKEIPDYPITVGNIEKSYLDSEEKMQGFFASLDGSVLNMHRPIVNYMPGEIAKINVADDFITVDILYKLVVSQNTDEDEVVELIVPGTPDNNQTNNTDIEDVGIVVLEEVDGNAADNGDAEVVEEAPVADEIVENPQDENDDAGVIILGDDNLPLTEGQSGDAELTDLDDSQIPLAVPHECWMHWLLLGIMGAYAVYQVVAISKRQKAIKNFVKVA